MSAARSGTLQRILSLPAAVPAAGRVRAGEMLQEESDLSLIIAQIVQKLKGSNLYAQLERQAWVSGADGKLWRPAGRRMTCLPHCFHPSQSSLLSPPLSGVLNPSLSLAPCLLRLRRGVIVFYKRWVGLITPFFKPENGHSFIYSFSRLRNLFFLFLSCWTH